LSNEGPNSLSSWRKHQEQNKVEVPLFHQSEENSMREKDQNISAQEEGVGLGIVHKG